MSFGSLPFSSATQVWISAPRSGITSVPNSQPYGVRPASAAVGTAAIATTRERAPRTARAYSVRTPLRRSEAERGVSFGHLAAVAKRSAVYRSGMIDHIGISVTDLARSIAFYERALAPLGYTVIMKQPQFAGLAVRGKSDLW